MLTLAFKPYDTSSTIHGLLLFLQALEQNTVSVRALLPVPHVCLSSCAALRLETCRISS